MKNDTTIWADEEDKVEVKIDAYSDGKYYVRIDIKPHVLNNLSLYLDVEQARELQKQLLDVALNAKYSYKKGKMPKLFPEEQKEQK